MESLDESVSNKGCSIKHGLIIYSLIFPIFHVSPKTKCFTIMEWSQIEGSVSTSRGDRSKKVSCLFWCIGKLRRNATKELAIREFKEGRGADLHTETIGNKLLPQERTSHLSSGPDLSHDPLKRIEYITGYKNSARCMYRLAFVICLIIIETLLFGHELWRASIMQIRRAQLYWGRCRDVAGWERASADFELMPGLCSCTRRICNKTDFLKCC